MTTEFTGHYSCEWDHNEGWFPSKAIFRFQLDVADPLTFRDDDGKLWRPGIKYLTDKGSIPTLFRGLYPHDRFERVYLLHDYGYQKGGLWLAPYLEEYRGGALLDGDDVFVKLSRDRLDGIMYRGTLAEGGRRAEARVIYGMVHLFAGRAWRRYRAAEATAIEKKSLS